VHANLTGQVEIGGDLLGTFQVGADLRGSAAQPALLVHGDLVGQIAIGMFLRGCVQINGDLHGTSDVPAIVVDWSLMGQIRIDGSLWDDDVEECPEIDVGGMPEPLGAAAIVVNWDGFGWEADQWEAGATIAVGEEVYAHSDLAAHVMTTTCQKGDMDGSGATDNFDITPFVQALSDPTGYDRDHPVIAGARDFHGDCNVDGAFNNFDITAFVLRVTNEDAYFAQYPTGGCRNPEPPPGDSGAPGSYDAQAVAAVLERSVDRQWMPHLIRIAEYVRDHSSDDGEVAFWTAVLAELQ
jgi:hypothetical protein